MKHRKRKTKTLLSITFAFLLTLLFFVLFVGIGLGIGVFNSRSVKSKINESNYYNRIYVELNKKADEIVKQAALPTAVLEDAITLERLYTDSNLYIDSALKGEKAKINTTKLQAVLTKHINQYFTKQGITKTKEIKSRTDEVTGRIIKEYQSIVKLQFINYYADYRLQFWKTMKLMIPLIIILIGVLCFFLMKIHHNKHRGLRYINYSLISSSLLMSFISMYMLIEKRYDKLNVMPYYYRDFLTLYLKWDIQMFVYIGVLGLILSAVLVSLTVFLKNRTSNN